MKHCLLHKSFLTGLLAVASVYSMQVSALPFEPFSFHQHTGFQVDGTLLSTTGNNNIGWYESASGVTPPAGEYDTIAWGTPITNSGGGLLVSDPISAPTGNPSTDLSGLRVTGHEGIMTTGADLGGGMSDWGGWETITTIYHQNRTIDASASMLASAIIRSVLWIDHEPPGDLFSDINSVGISFTETLNALPCSMGNPNGSVCDDLFDFGLGTFQPISFYFEGHKYEIEFGIANFVDSFTNFPACPGGICTVWTAEDVTSSMDIQARIREVPEPGILGLIAIGLFGLGFAKRRKLDV